MGERGFTKPCKNYCKQLIVFFLNFLNSFVHDCRMVIQKLKAHFSRFGVPDELYTDNGFQSGVLYTRQAVLDFLRVMVLSKEQCKQPREC